jgi:hypothetical protein
MRNRALTYAYAPALAAALSTRSTGDYAPHAPVCGDNAGPGLQALAHGNLAGFVHLQPLMGLTSLLLRVPAVALGSSDLARYRFGSLACLLACALPLAAYPAASACRRPAVLGSETSDVAAAPLKDRP